MTLDPIIQPSGTNTGIFLRQLVAGECCPEMWGAKGDGITDDTSAIQAALTFAKNNGGGTVRLAGKGYLASATLIGSNSVNIKGDGANCTRLIVNHAGDTIQYGSPGSASVRAGTFKISDIFFIHATAYVAGDASLNNRLTGGQAHIRVTGGQFVWIERCFFWRKPYGIVFDATVNISVTDSFFSQTWDTTNGNLQEGIAGVSFAPTIANNQLAVLRGNYFTGSVSPSRSITYSDGSTSVTTNQIGNIGSQYGVLNGGCEGLICAENYFGRHSVSSVKLAPVSTSFIAIDQRFVGNFFDDVGNGSAGSQFSVQASGAGVAVLGLTISGNIFNGETDSLNGILIVPGTSNAPSAYSVTITGNTMFAHVATPIVLTGACGVTIGPNTITNYNCLGAAAAAGSKTYNSAIYTGPYSSNISIRGNVLGGGGNTFAPIGDPSNHCYYGAFIDGSASSFQQGNHNAGVTNFAASQFPEAVIFGNATSFAGTASFAGAVGFNGASPSAPLSITGSRSGNTAGVVSEIIYILKTFGLAIDNTSA